MPLHEIFVAHVLNDVSEGIGQFDVWKLIGFSRLKSPLSFVEINSTHLLGSQQHNFLHCHNAQYLYTLVASILIWRQRLCLLVVSRSMDAEEFGQLKTLSHCPTS
jgi:hypothetical protein